MITNATSSRVVFHTPARGVAQNLDEAIAQAETGALHIQASRSATHQSSEILDGYQGPATDISRDTPFRDVSDSGRQLREKADATSASAQNASGSGYTALEVLSFAITALDKAIPDLAPAQREEALRARNGLDQQDELWNADVQLGTALANINGGAYPYIQAAEGDSPGQDVSWVGGEITGNLRDSQACLEQAGFLSGGSLAAVRTAVAALRDLRSEV